MITIFKIMALFATVAVFMVICFALAAIYLVYRDSGPSQQHTHLQKLIAEELRSARVCDALGHVEAAKIHRANAESLQNQLRSSLDNQ